MVSALIWVISLSGILLMLLRPRHIPEWIWISATALLLVATRLLPLAGAVAAVREGTDVYFFLAGMMLLSELAREEGVFDWVAGIAVHHSRGSSARLFFWVYLCGIFVTALLSNDATAVVLTPAVLAAVRHARVDEKPHLLACALVANAASFLLPISNPANLVVFGQRLPTLGSWMHHLLLPSVASIAATYLCLWFVSRRALSQPTEPREQPARLPPAGRLALLGILIAAAGLLVASGLGAPLGMPTCAAGLFAMLLIATQDRRAPLNALRNVAWSVIPLVAGLFIIVEALNRAGLLRLTRIGLDRLLAMHDLAGKFAAAGSVALLSNVMNNLPVGLAAGSVLRHNGQAGLLAHAALIGVDLGPNLSVTGSLATILWLIALRREGEEITPWQFLKVGVLAMPVALVLALLVLR